MKKLSLFSLLVLAFALGSCKKDRTCECTSTTTYSSTSTNGTTNTTTSPPSTTTTEFKKVKKSSLDFSCGNRKYTNTSANSDGSSSTNITDVKCSIK